EAARVDREGPPGRRSLLPGHAVGPARPPLNAVMRRRLRVLHGIPFRAILTTNFDGVLPGELPNRDAFLAVLRPRGHRWWDQRFWDAGAEGATVVKLHGSHQIGRAPSTD